MTGEAPRAAFVVRDLAAGYGTGLVVREVSLTIDEGEIVGLVGRNGAGKTTTLKSIVGEIPRAHGVVLLDGAVLPASPSRCARAGVSYVPEGRQLFAALTVEENIKVGATVGRSPSAKARELVIQRCCSILPRLQPLLDRRAESLSGGEQQMVAIARGLAADPRVLLVDEMTLGLAPVAAMELLSELKTIVASRGMAVLLVDQNAEVLAKFASRILVLHEGVIAESVTDYGGGLRDILDATYFGSAK